MVVGGGEGMSQSILDLESRRRLKLYIVRTVHFGMKLYNNQRNPQFLNLFFYLLLTYMFRAFSYPIIRGRCTYSAVVQVSWVWCQRP
jgi:hypothetical protein